MICLRRLVLPVLLARASGVESMSEVHSESDLVRRLKVSDTTRRAYERRDKRQDHADPDAPVMPPEFWDGASIGKYYRPRETQI
jgi:hypothetical protein